MKSRNTNQVNWHPSLCIDIDIRLLPSSQVRRKPRCQESFQSLVRDFQKLGWHVGGRKIIAIACRCNVFLVVAPGRAAVLGLGHLVVSCPRGCKVVGVDNFAAGTEESGTVATSTWAISGHALSTNKSQPARLCWTPRKQVVDSRRQEVLLRSRRCGFCWWRPPSSDVGYGFAI